MIILINLFFIKKMYNSLLLFDLNFGKDFNQLINLILPIIIFFDFINPNILQKSKVTKFLALF